MASIGTWRRELEPRATIGRAVASADKSGRTGGTTPAKRAAGARGKGAGARGARTTGKKSGSSTKGAANRRSRSNPPHKRRGHRLTMYDRVSRARTIAAERAQTRPTAWKAIAAKVGLSESQCREVYADYLRWNEDQEDPLGVVDDTINSLTVAMDEAADTAAHADPGSAARVGAVRMFVEASTTRLALMQAAGKVPRYLGQFAAEREMRVIFEEFAELLRKHDVRGAILDDFIDLARRAAARRQGRQLPAAPDVDGEAQAAA